MFVIELLIFVTLSIKDAVSLQVCVSEAHVVNMEAHVSPVATLLAFAILELGFDTLVMLILDFYV